LRARGGLEIDIAWSDSSSAVATVHALRSAEHRFRPPVGFRFLSTAEVMPQADGTVTLRMEEGKTYRLKAIQS
jgi:hypothetical protein